MKSTVVRLFGSGKLMPHCIVVKKCKVAANAKQTINDCGKIRISFIKISLAVKYIAVRTKVIKINLGTSRLQRFSVLNWRGPPPK